MRKHNSGKISTHCLCENPEHLVMLGVSPPPGPIAKHIPCSHALFFPLPKTQCRETTDCLGTRSKRMRLSSWSSSSITAASGYICSMSKWNWTPAGGSRRKFLLSWRQGEHQGEENKQAVHTRSSGNTFVERCATVTHCRQSQHLLLDGFFFVVTHPGRHCHFWGHTEISLITKQSSRRRDDSVYGCLTQRMRGQRNIMKLDLFLLSWSYDPCGTSSFSGKCIIGSSYSVRDCSSHWITF